MGINYKKDTNKGYYEIINKDKYYPSGRIPIYKSGWELTVFHALDINPNVIGWGYEAIQIYYFSPKYSKYTIYYPDILCQIRMDSGAERRLLIEIKPAKYMVMPKQPYPPKTNDPEKWRRYNKSLVNYKINNMDYLVNIAKWEAAERFCQKNNIMWRILSEKNTYNLFK